MNWHDDEHRSSAPQAYLTPVESIRTNWLTLTEHLVSSLSNFQLFPSEADSKVTKILWSQTTLPLVASGVEFAPYSPGTPIRYNAFARREVIMAAGVIKVYLHLNAYAQKALLTENLDLRRPRFSSFPVLAIRKFSIPWASRSSTTSPPSARIYRSRYIYIYG